MNEPLLIDLALTVAIADHRGNVPLLVPVLRPEARKLWGHADFVLKIFRLVDAVSQDARYAIAFAPELPEREGSVEVRLTAKPSRVPWHKVVSGQALGVFQSIRARFIPREAPADPALPTGPISSADEHDHVADDVLEDLGESSLPPSNSLVSYSNGECAYSTELTVQCVDGRLQDVAGYDRGICPNCGFGRKHAAPG